MRTDLISTVPGLPDDAASGLTDLGISINDDGTLKLSDRDALTAAAERDPEALQQLFAADEGLGTRLLRRLDTFVKTDGILDSRRDSTEARIDRIEKRIDRWDDRLARREEALRLQYAQLQEALALFDGQQQVVNAYFLSGLGAY